MRNIEVCMDHYRSTCHPNSLISEGIGPCIAIGIYDRLNRKGYLIHEPDPLSEKMTRFINMVLRQSILANLIVKVTGGSIFDDDIDPEGVINSRREIEGIIHLYFNGSNIIFDWPPENSYCAICISTLNELIEVTFF